MRRWIRTAVFTIGFMAGIMPVETALAGAAASVLDILLQKGVITEDEYPALMEQQRADEEAAAARISGLIAEAAEQARTKEHGWEKRVKLSGLLEGEYRWMNRRDRADKNSASTSDLYVRRLEVGFDSVVTDWIKVNSVLNSEFIGDTINQGDEKITVDAATITLQRKDVSFYLVLGKRTQPFGVFENHLVTDPMTQDAYETKRVGATLGAAAPSGFDLSATLYQGEGQMDHLVGSRLFEVSRTNGLVNDVDSFILSATISPVEDRLTLFGGYLSEPGRGSRNDTASFGLSVAVPGIQDFKLDGEYMKAMKRERYDGLDQAFKEGIFSVTISYVINNDGKRREELGGATLEEKRAHIFEEPLHFAFRYERFDDDELARKTSSWSAKNRYSLGAIYPFFKDEENGLAAFAAAEYRHADYRLHGGARDTREDAGKEIYVKLGAAF